jgi:hypothetical protein
MAIYDDITIFDSDDVTPLLGAVDGSGNITQASFSTDPTHPRPYLLNPNDSARAEARIDVFRGSCVVGEILLEVNDNPRAGFNQQGGIFTWLLAGANGEAQLVGKRVVKRRIENGVPKIVYDGVIGSPQLNDDLASFSFGLRDIRDRSRLGPLFPSACIRNAAGNIVRAPTILPAGTFHNYGETQPGSGVYVSPAATPQVGYYNAGRKQIRWPIGDWDQDKLKRHQVASKHMLEVGAARYTQSNDIFPVTFRHVENVSILWRPVGGGVWNEAKRQNLTGLGVNLFHLDPVAKYNGQQANGILGIYFNPTGGITAPPADGQTIEFLVVYTGPPTETWPLHVDGTFGSILKDICDGVYSPSYDAALGVKPLRIRYNAVKMAEFAAQSAPARARIFAPVDGKDVPGWLARNIFQASFHAPGLDENWALAPIYGAMPDVSVPVLQLTNDNSAPDSPKWLHDAGTAISVVNVSFPIETVDDTDVFGERTKGDRIAEIPDGFEAHYQSGSIAEVGEQVLDISPITVRDAAIVNVGFPFNETMETFGAAASIVVKLKNEIFDRSRYGVQRFPLLASTADAGVKTAKPGDWCQLNQTWLPEYSTRLRGASRIAQIVSVNDIDPAWRRFIVETGGAVFAVFIPPVFGPLSVDAAGILSIPVTSIPAGGEAHVQVAFALSAPAADSNKWMTVGRVPAPQTITTQPIPIGLNAHVRARTEAAGRRPSNWTAVQSIVPPARASFRTFELELNADGQPVATWTVEPGTLGVRLYYDQHDGDDEFSAEGFVDVSAAAGEYIFTQALTDEMFSVEAVPYTGFGGGAVSGNAGTPAQRTVARELFGIPLDQRAAGIEGALLAFNVTALGVTQYYISAQNYWMTVASGEWEAWLKKGAWPTKAGTTAQTDEPDDTYKLGRFDGEIRAITILFELGDGDYRVMFRARSRFNASPGQMYFSQMTVTGGVGTSWVPHAARRFIGQIDKVSDAVHDIIWATNLFAPAGPTIATVDITASLNGDEEKIIATGLPVSPAKYTYNYPRGSGPNGFEYGRVIYTMYLRDAGGVLQYRIQDEINDLVVETKAPVLA